MVRYILDAVRFDTSLTRKRRIILRLRVRLVSELPAFSNQRLHPALALDILKGRRPAQQKVVPAFASTGDLGFEPTKEGV